jgi:hypothetical protein
MNRRMAPGTPAASLAQALGMIGVADENTAVISLNLCVALEAKVWIALD